jgi:hypothetical protein
MNSYNTPTLKRNVSEYISGFVDGEGCFSISFSIRPKLNVGWEVKPSFCVGQNYDRREVLDIMQSYFGCGNMRRDYHDKTLKYEVRSLEELITKILPHFEKFPLYSGKQKDFEKFAKICGLMKNFKHLKISGLKKILDIAYTMNSSGRRRYTKEQITNSFKMKI